MNSLNNGFIKTMYDCSIDDNTSALKGQLGNDDIINTQRDENECKSDDELLEGKIKIKEKDVPRYRKVKESNVSKSKRKSKHKHQYEECLIRYHLNYGYGPEKDLTTSLYSYCTICGKISRKFDMDESIVDYDRITVFHGLILHSRISSEELYERFHDKLPVFYVNDIRKDRYVDLKGD